MILQNFVPHPRYYGREVAEIADRGGTRRWGRDGDPSGGATAGEAPPEGSSSLLEPPEGELLEPPTWATPVTIDDIKRLIQECKRLMPDVGVQVPPNLSDCLG